LLFPERVAAHYAVGDARTFHLPNRVEGIQYKIADYGEKCAQ
jgi:hypothetical protein